MRSPRTPAAFALLVTSVVLATSFGDAWAAAPVAASPLARLVRRLKSAGRAEVQVTRTSQDPVSGTSRLARGRMALEPPDRMSLTFGASGERIVLRGDGGEWLQPHLRQVLKLGPERAAAVSRWWRVLLGEDEGGVTLDRLAAGRYRVTVADAGAEAQASGVLELDGAGLPRKLEIDEGLEQPTVYRFAAWTFVPPRGASAFTIATPSGYEAVPMP